MKRKFFSILCVVLLVLSSICFSACQAMLDKFFGHIHNVDYDFWASDENGHWHLCDGCDGKFVYQSHKYASSKSVACSVCGRYRNVENLEPGDYDLWLENPPISSNQLTEEYIYQNANSTYGYRWLMAQENGIKLAQYYAQIDNAAQKVWEGTASFDMVVAEAKSYIHAGRIETKTLTLDEAKMVYNVYCLDHPYNFWQSQAILYGTVDDGTYCCYIVMLDQFNTYAKINSAKEIINSNIKKAYAAADEAATPYEAALAMYVKIARLGNYTYDSSGNPSEQYWAHSIVGLLDNDDATGPVCEGYARVYQLLLNLKKVDNIYCVGTATSNGKGGGGGHAWNMVRLDDDKWYYCDLTWDDEDGNSLNFDYFLLSSSAKVSNLKFTQTHTAGSPTNSQFFLYDLPTNIASEAFSGVVFAANSTAVDGNFVYIRVGLDEVAVKEVRSTGSVVKIPATVEIAGKTYTVTSIGPNTNSEGQRSTIFVYQSLSRSVVLPATVTSIRMGAFFAAGTLKIFFEGTRAQWNAITLENNAFYPSNADFGSSSVYCAGEWTYVGEIPTPN